MTSYELSQKEDEWMDISAREELLQKELSQVKAISEQCSKELKESVSTRRNEKAITSDRIGVLEKLVEELTGQKRSLEGERESLHTETKQQNESLAHVRQNLDDSTAREEALKKELDGSCARISSLDKLANELEAEKEAMRVELTQVKMASEHLTKQLRASLSEEQKELKESRNTVGSVSKMVEELKGQKVSLERLWKNQKDNLDVARIQLKESGAREVALSKELSNCKISSSQRSEKLEEAQGHIKTLAVLAEELKGQKVSVERSLKQQQLTWAKMEHDRETASATKDDLVSQALSELKNVSDELKNVSDEHEDSSTANRKELEDARELIGTLTKSVDDLKSQSTSLEGQLETAKIAAEVSAKATTDLTDSDAREGALRKELAEVKKSSEDRLKVLRSILGVIDTRCVQKVL